MKAECTIELDTKIANERLSYTFTKITERFEPWKEINRLRLISNESGHVTLECVESHSEKKLYDTPSSPGGKNVKGFENLYEGVENQIIKYIHGAPIRLFTLSLSVVNSQISTAKQAFQIQVLNSGFNKQICTVEISEERVFKDLLPLQI